MYWVGKRIIENCKFLQASGEIGSWCLESNPKTSASIIKKKKLKIKSHKFCSHWLKKQWFVSPLWLTEGHWEKVLYEVQLY